MKFVEDGFMKKKSGSPKKDGSSRTESSGVDAQVMNLGNQWSRYEMNVCRQTTRRRRRSRIDNMNNAITHCEVMSASARSIETRERLIFKKSETHTCNPSAVCGNFWKTNSKERARRVMSSPESIQTKESRK